MSTGNDQKLRSAFNAILILMLYVLCGFGMFSFIKSLGLSKTISLGVSVMFFIGALALLFIIGFIKNKPNGKKKITRLIAAICLVVIVVNIGLITISPYFLPHNTTTANNKYYIKPFKYSYLIDNYTQDKIVYVASDNTLINEDTDETTALDKSNQLALYSSAKSVETMDNIKQAAYEQTSYILSLDGEFEYATQEYALTKNAVFYTGMDFDAFDEVVILQDINYDTYFMPYEFYKSIENMR